MKIKRTLMILVFFGFAILALSLMANHAEATNKYWISDTNQNSGTASAWSGGTHPINGDNLFYASNHTGTCTINQTITFGNIIMGASSGSVVGGSVNFGYADLTITGGTWSGSTVNTQTCSGNIVETNGVFPYPTGTILIYTKEGGTISSVNMFLRSISFQANSSISGTVVSSNLIIGVGKTVTINPSAVLSIYTNSGCGGSTFSNSGTIVGTGTMRILMVDTGNTFTLGAVKAPLLITLDDTYGSSQTLKLAANAVLGNTVNVLGKGARWTTLDLNGKSLTSLSLTVTFQGIILSSAANARLVIQCHKYRNDKQYWNIRYIRGCG
jgi:hypothetical protein